MNGSRSMVIDDGMVALLGTLLLQQCHANKHHTVGTSSREGPFRHQEGDDDFGNEDTSGLPEVASDAHLGHRRQLSDLISFHAVTRAPRQPPVSSNHRHETIYCARDQKANTLWRMASPPHTLVANHCRSRSRWCHLCNADPVARWHRIR